MWGVGGKFLLDQAGQVAEIKQNSLYQVENIHWARRAFKLDCVSLLLDALDHSKEEIRSYYETYAARIDTILLVLALIWPFALNTIQFSDPFVPQTQEECDEAASECIEVKYQWLIGVWMFLMGVILILPFWGILMMIRCKLKLDSWLEYALAGLNGERRRILGGGLIRQEDDAAPEEAERRIDPTLGGRAVTFDEMCEQHVEMCDPTSRRKSDDQLKRHWTNLKQVPADGDSRQMADELVDVVLQYQEYLSRIWTAECGWLVQAATTLLWMSAVAALLLTSISMLIFLTDKGGEHADSAPYFGVLITCGCVLPAVYVMQQRLWNTVRPPDGDPAEMFDAAFPLAQSVRAKVPGKRFSTTAERSSMEPRSSKEEGGLATRNGSFNYLHLLGRVRCCTHRQPDSRSPLLGRGTE